MSDITCNICGNVIDCTDAIDAGWIAGYYINSVFIDAPLCDTCRKYHVKLNELGRMEYIESE